MNGAEYLDRMADELMIKDVNWEDWLNPEEASKIRDASTYNEQVKERFLNPELATGYRLPWKKVENVRVRKSEASLWIGFNKSRKSMIRGFVDLGMVAQGSKICVMSFEMKPVATLSRMAKQFVGNPEPTLPALDDYFDFLKGNFYLYDQQGTVSASRVLAVARYAITELGCDQVVIDSLMKCGIKKNNGWDAQIDFIDALSTMTKDTGGHIHLVAHSKKPEKFGSAPPNRYDAKGTTELSDMVDNVYIIYANKDEGAQFNQEFIVDVQREGGDVPPYGLIFDEQNFQFKPYSSAPRMTPEDWRQCRWQ